MALWAKPVPLSFWLLNFCFVTSAELYRLSNLQLVTPQEAPGLPKRLNMLRVNNLLLSVYDSDTGRLVPRNGYIQESQDFWRKCNAWCLGWDPWVEITYQALVREVNASAPQAEPYYMQILKICEVDDAASNIRAVTRYALNGEEVLRYQSDQNRWFSVHPSAWPLAERWNQAKETFAEITPQRCMFFIEQSAQFITGKTAQPTARVALIPGTQALPRRLICHVTGFYPHHIEVTWERGGQVAQGEQLSSGIRPNADPTFQTQVSIELGQEGTSPAEHVCVVRHSSLGNTTLRVTWDSQPPGLADVLGIVAGCILTALALGALVWCLWKRPGALKPLYRPARTQPGTLDSALATANSSSAGPS
nr:DLA class II histocompatibility antigen, DR-1 beta chain-like [Pelodiscus sinensis]|eukprot:XP_025042212.1 DLA class II histocompatibility antigen, DR-1 beta chain-like [Pelodiscus sinensis]